MSEVIQDQAQYGDIKEKFSKAKQNLADMKLDNPTGASEPECNDVKQRFKAHKFRWLSLKITDTKKPPEPIVKRKKFFDKSEGGSPSQILADFANAENLTEDKLPSPYILAQLLMDEENFLILGGALHVFTGIVYEVLDDAAFDRLIMKKLRKYIEVGGRPEILRAIRTFVKVYVIQYIKEHLSGVPAPAVTPPEAPSMAELANPIASDSVLTAQMSGTAQ